MFIVSERFDWSVISLGLPQDAILKPLFYIVYAVYINPVLSSICVSVDDTDACFCSQRVDAILSEKLCFSRSGDA